jgi:hypothetical protein
MTSVRGVQQTGRRASRSEAVDWLARGGFIARGLIYGIVGVLAFKLALGIGGGRTTTQQGALDTIARQPFGEILLIAVAVGLAGYSLWRAVQAAYGLGPEGGGDHKAIMRIAALGSCIAYAILCVGAVSILVGASSSSSSPGSTTAGVLGWPGGRVLVVAAGLVVIAVGLYQGYRAVTRGFLDDAKTGEMSPRTLKIVTVVGVIGHLARMVVFVLVGAFLVRAAYRYAPGSAIGLDGALATVARESYGRVLLAVLSAGLVAFALHSASDARYRRT